MQRYSFAHITADAGHRIWIFYGFTDFDPLGFGDSHGPASGPCERIACGGDRYRSPLLRRRGGRGFPAHIFRMARLRFHFYHLARPAPASALEIS